MKVIRLYIEKIDKVEGFILLDFVSEEEYLYYKYNGDVTDNMSVDYCEATMMIANDLDIKNVEYAESDVIEILAKDLLNSSAEKYEGSPIVGYKFTNVKAIQPIFENAHKVPFSINCKNTTSMDECNFNRVEELEGSINVEVMNVGQGSWNRISSSNMDILFDFGASIFNSRADNRKLLDDSGGVPRNNKETVLMISHWDIDHYSLVQSMTDDELQGIKCVFAPEYHVTLTSENVIRRLKNMCIGLNLIKGGTGGSNDLFLIYTNKNLDIWIGSNKKNINKTGIAMNVYGESEAILFTADHHYCQVWDVMYEMILKRFSLNKKINMCVPHHGGSKGVITLNKRINANRAIASTGKNNYGHPSDAVRRYLLGIGFKWIRTDYNGDILLHL